MRLSKFEPHAARRGRTQTTSAMIAVDRARGRANPADAPFGHELADHRQDAS